MPPLWCVKHTPAVFHCPPYKSKPHRHFFVMKSARLLTCCRCHTLVSICSACDRGNRYCGPICTRNARKVSVDRANRKYRSSIKGRLANAARQARYRARQKIVTHQGSRLVRSRDLLQAPLQPSGCPTVYRFQHGITCCICSVLCDPFVRSGPIRYAKRD